jgi:hypothetical protein
MSPIKLTRILYAGWYYHKHEKEGNVWMDFAGSGAKILVLCPKEKVEQVVTTFEFRSKYKCEK